MGSEGLTDDPVTQRVERFAAMGTRIELHLFGPGDDDALFHARRAVEAVDDALTIHRPSPTVALNEALRMGPETGAREAAIDDALLLAALEEARALSALTGGLFDPTAGGTGAGWDAIELDTEAGRIRAARPLAFDFGGFGKGFALDRAAAALKAAGAVSAFLSAGESSIAAVGRHPLRVPWPVGVPHPFVADAFLVELALEDEALSISSTLGSAALGRSPTVRPATGEPMAEPRTAVAAEPSGAAAEAMSTALLIADGREAERLAGARPARRFAFRFDGRHAIALTRERDFEFHG